jgi:hypothetical protein
MSINSNLVDVMKKEYEFELHYGKLWVTLRQTMGYITTNYGLHYDKLVLTLRVSTSPLPPITRGCGCLHEETSQRFLKAIDKRVPPRGGWHSLIMFTSCVFMVGNYNHLINLLLLFHSALHRRITSRY